MMLSRRERILIVILMILAIYYGYYLYFYSPLKLKIENLVQENQQLNAVAVLGQQLQPTKEAQLKEYEQMQLFENLIEQVPDLSYIPESINFLEALAKNNNVELITLDYKDDAKLDAINSDDKGGWKECNYLINVGGEYQNLLKFLQGIEKSKRIYNIEKAAIAVKQILNVDSMMPESSKNFDGNNLILTIAFKSYYDEIFWTGASNTTLDIIKPYEGRKNPFVTQ